MAGGELQRRGGAIFQEVQTMSALFAAHQYEVISASHMPSSGTGYYENFSSRLHAQYHNVAQHRIERQEEQSSCNKIHNVLATFLRKPQVSSPVTSCELASLYHSCLSACHAFHDDPDITFYRRILQQEPMWHFQANPPAQRLRDPEKEENIVHFRPCRSYTHHASRRETSAEWRCFFN